MSRWDEEPGECLHCGRSMRCYSPVGSDGTVSVAARHKHSGEWCPGSGLAIKGLETAWDVIALDYATRIHKDEASEAGEHE